MAPPVQQPGASRREFLIFFYKYRMRLFLSFLFPFALAIAVSFVPTPRYKASSVLIVRLGSEYVYQPETGAGEGGGNPTLPFEHEQIFKSEVAILSSQDLHRQLIQNIGVDTLYPELTHPKGLSLVVGTARNLVQNELIKLGLASEEPPMPQQEADQRKLANAVEMFDHHFDILLERESAVITVSFEHKDPALATRALDELLRLYYEKRKQIFTEPRAELAASQMEATKDHAAASQRALQDYKLRHRIYSMDDQRRQLLAERAQLQKQSMSITNPEIESRLASYNRQLDQLDASEKEYNTLQKDADIANESYSLYSHRLDEAKAYEDLQRERIGAVRIIQPPTAPPDPKRMQGLIILVGAFVSLIFTLLVAAITEFSRRGFIVPEQIERSIGLPVLAVIPRYRNP